MFFEEIDGIEVLMAIRALQMGMQLLQVLLESEETMHTTCLGWTVSEPSMLDRIRSNCICSSGVRWHRVHAVFLGQV